MGSPLLGAFLEHLEIAPGRKGAPASRDDQGPNRGVTGVFGDPGRESFPHGERHGVAPFGVVKAEGDDVGVS
jgi:hypothetical protein